MCNVPLSKTINRYHQHEHQYTNKADNLHSNNDKNNKVGSHGSNTTQDSTNKVHYINAYSPETIQEEIHDGDYVINPDERHSMRVTLRLNYNTKQHCNKEFANKVGSNKKTSWQHCTRINNGHIDKANNVLKENEVNKKAATKEGDTVDNVAVHSNHRPNANEKGGSTSAYAEHSHTSLATPLLAALLSEYESYNRQVKLKALQELLHKQHESASSPLQSCLVAADGDVKRITHHGLECKSNEVCKTTRTKLTDGNEVHLGELGNEPFSPDSKSITNTERQTSLFSIKGGISSEEEVLSMNTAGLTCTSITMFHEVPVVYCDQTLNDKFSVHWQAPPMQPELQNNTNINKVNTPVISNSTITNVANNKNNLVRQYTVSNATASSSLLPPRSFVVPPSQAALTHTSEPPPLLQQMQKYEKIQKPFAPEGNINFTHCGSSQIEHNKNNHNHKVEHSNNEENCRGHNSYEHTRSKSNSTLEWSSSQNAIYTSTNSYSHNNSHGSVGANVDMNGNTLSTDTQIATPFSTLLSPIMVHENKFTSALLKPSLTATVTHSSHNLFGVDNYHVTLTTSMLNEYIERKQKEMKEKEQEVQQQQQQKRKSDMLLAHAEKITHNKRHLHEGHNILKKQQESEQSHYNSNNNNNNSTDKTNYTKCTHLTATTPSQNFSVNRLESKEVHDANEMAER